MQRKIDKQCRAAFSAQHFVETNDSTLARNQVVSRLLAEFLENRIQKRVFEFLRDDRALQIEKTTGQAEPLEITVVIAGNHDAALRSVASRLLKILQLDVVAKIFQGQARAPQEIEHRSGKMLK